MTPMKTDLAATGHTGGILDGKATIPHGNYEKTHAIRAAKATLVSEEGWREDVVF